MRAAPAVTLAARSGAGWHLALMLLLALAGAAVLLWATDRGDGVSWLTAGICVAAAAMLAWRQGRCRARWRLGWDGRVWQLQVEHGAPAQCGDMAVMLDLGDALLLRFVPAGHGSATWLPLQRTDAAADWHALRCALYSPRRAPSGTAS